MPATVTAFKSEDAFAELWYTVSTCFIFVVVDVTHVLTYVLFQIKAIKLVTGVTPTCWRPPYGDVDVSCVVIS